MEQDKKPDFEFEFSIKDCIYLTIIFIQAIFFIVYFFKH